MGIFKKNIEVSVEHYGKIIILRITVSGAQISKIQCSLQPDGSLLIGDISPFKKKKYYNKGYCSIMMKKLLEYASNNGIHTICGNLSLVDINHKNRLHAFYVKHGFDIVEFETTKGLFYGKIIKKI